MSQLDQFRETLKTYLRHGWQPARVLMRSATLAELRASATPGADEFETIAVSESAIDAMWFKRPAQGGREAWELRLVSESPYALFEMFETDEAEEDREDVRRELEARMDAKVNANDERWNSEDEM